MRFFKDNKIVSKARKGILNNGDEDQFIPKEAEHHAVTSDDQIDILEDYKKPIEEVIEHLQSDKCYTDFLEYLSASGIFNLTDGTRFEEWLEMEKIIQAQGSGYSLGVNPLASKNLPTNP